MPLPHVPTQRPPLLQALTAADLAIGAELTIFDPDLDPDGHQAHELTAAVVEGFAHSAVTGPDRRPAG